MQKNLFTGAVAAAVFAAAPVQAQTYPAKAIQMIVPVQAGSGADAILRREARALNHPYPMPPYDFTAQCAACMEHDALDRLAGIRVPTLIAAEA